MGRSKEVAARAAAEFITSGMTVGLGSGSTAAYFIDALAEKDLEIVAVATSQASEQRAKGRGIEVVDVDDVPHIDIVVDGADEVDPAKRLIKGGGGALLREKIIATLADEMVVIVDNSKLVKHLGHFGLPLEVVPFGHRHTLEQLKVLGYNPALRDGRSDNGNCIIDLHFDRFLENPEEEDRHLRTLPGVIETGLFLDLAGRIVVGYEDGHVEVTQ